ncbi:cytosolic phospholipase A2 gamma [Mus pahari]|uniref:cytosolic phospholipase A2 gamma n=1 Tax=Mus pahari TaxID=10093 RepID=UPI000A30B404|nr:cytosolic phospholipase A2 gamma [Mus pahari]
MSSAESPKSRSSGVCFATGLQEEEKAAVHKRSPKVLEALQRLNIQADQAPVIAVLGSGGGLRAHIAYLGVLSEMKELGLLDAVTYLAGVSGSTWALSSLYTKNGNMEWIEELKHRYEKSEWDFGESLTKAIRASKEENYSLTDFWAYLIVSRQIRELQELKLSSLKEQVEEGVLPYPIFAAIDEDLLADWKKCKNKNSWFEFTPHHAGYPALGAYVHITEFGSRFENGKLDTSKPERDLTFLRGLWGSAFAFVGIKEIKTYVLNYFRNLCEKFNFIKGLVTYSEAPKMEVDKMLLDLVMTYFTDKDDPSIKDKLCALQQALGTERDEFGIEMAEIIQNWNETSPEKKEQFLDHLLDCFKKTQEDPTAYSLNSFMVWDLCVFVNETRKCISKWQWGTVYNFLYKHGKIADEAMCSREFLHLVDAGFAINSPYPLVLPPARETHLILSFDFSDGDPLETIRTTADYCQRHKIPFPEVSEDQLKEWAEAPASCYVLRGKTGPVVMHFTLFNKDNCGDDIETWRKKYGTLKLSDSYTPDLVTDLLRLSKENVQKNKINIINEMRKVAGNPGNMACLGDRVHDAQGSQTVEFKKSHNIHKD